MKRKFAFSTLILALSMFLVLPVTGSFAATTTLYPDNYYWGKYPDVGSRSLATGNAIDGDNSTTDTMYYKNHSNNYGIFKYYGSTGRFVNYISLTGIKTPFNYLSAYYVSTDGVTHDLGITSDPSKVLINENVMAVGFYNNGSVDIVFGEFTVNETFVSYNNISNITHIETDGSSQFSWSLPTGSSSTYTGLNIYKDGSLVKTLGATETSYKFTDLQSNHSYTFDFESLYSDGGKSSKKSATVTTEPPPPEPVKPISELEASAEYNRVDLSWTLPDTSNFKKVNIYRDTVEKETALSSFFSTKVYAAAQTKIFETNGTYFNDLTVKPDTTYEYTLTTTGSDGTESTGKDVTVTTPEEPPPTMEGGNVTRDDNGDYTYQWTSPTTGKIKVMIGGTEYKTVPASDQSITIPKDQMKYDTFGSPDIKVVPISEYGTVGETEKPGETLKNISLPFGAKDLVDSGMSLIFIFGPFILLALAFLFVPKLRKLLFKSFKKEKALKEKDSIKERVPRERSERTIKEPKERVRQSRETREIKRAPREPRARRERIRPQRQSRDRTEHRKG